MDYMLHVLVLLDLDFINDYNVIDMIYKIFIYIDYLRCSYIWNSFIFLFLLIIIIV